MLNQEYYKIFLKLEPEEEIPEEYYDSQEDLPQEEEKWLENISFSEKDIKRAIMMTTSTSPGPSGIGPKLAKMTVDTITPTLFKLFRKMIDDRTVPKINLINHISPLLKPGKDPSKPGSYRPVSLTEFFFRVLEKVLKTRMASHADRFGVLSNDQHGFRRQHSTTTNLLLHYDKIINRMEKGETVDIVLLDMSRAFDRVSHFKLIK